MRFIWTGTSLVLGFILATFLTLLLWIPIFYPSYSLTLATLGTIITFSILAPLGAAVPLVLSLAFWLSFVLVPAGLVFGKAIGHPHHS